METLASLVDKLTIVNIKCFMMVDVHGDKSLTDKERLDAADKVRTLNSQRNELVKELDQFLFDAVNGNVEIKSNVVKMYKGGGSG